MTKFTLPVPGTGRYSWKGVLSLVFFILLAGCATMGEEEDETRDWTAEKFFREAKAALQGGDYQTSIEYFEKLEARFPFGRFAQQAQLEIAYAYYKYDEPESAIAEADRFIKLHPRHQHVDYAYYLRGLASFSFEPSGMEEFFGKDPADIDPGGARRSFNYYKDLISKFPASRYAADAQKRMIYLRELLAKHEVKVALYYLESDAYVAAANRAKYVVEHYQGTRAANRALRVMVEAYRLLDMQDLAQDANRVLKLNQTDEKKPAANNNTTAIN